MATQEIEDRIAAMTLGPSVAYGIDAVMEAIDAYALDQRPARVDESLDRQEDQP